MPASPQGSYVQDFSCLPSPNISDAAVIAGTLTSLEAKVYDDYRSGIFMPDCRQMQTSSSEKISIIADDSTGHSNQQIAVDSQSDEISGTGFAARKISCDNAAGIPVNTMADGSKDADREVARSKSSSLSFERNQALFHAKRV